MNHPDMEAQVDALLDGELSSEEAAAVESHLGACSTCTRFRAERLALRSAIAAGAPRHTASPELRERVRAAVRQEAGSRTTAGGRTWRRPTISFAPAWLAAAATVALVAVGSWRLGASHAAAGALQEQVLASHVRSLMPGHLSDVVSSNQHTVKPWFNGRLDFSPPVHDFAGRGYPLLGGRLDYVGGRPVAALVYGRRQHIISVFMWPAASAEGPAAPAARSGYHLLHWATDEFNYWVVSDVGLAEFTQFAGMLRAADSATSSSYRP